MIWLHLRLDPLTLSGLKREVAELSKSVSCVRILMRPSKIRGHLISAAWGWGTARAVVARVNRRVRMVGVSILSERSMDSGKIGVSTPP